MGLGKAVGRLSLTLHSLREAQSDSQMLQTGQRELEQGFMSVCQGGGIFASIIQSNIIVIFLDGQSWHFEGSHGLRT